MSRLVLTVDVDVRSRRGVLYVLSRDPRISVGKLVRDRLPVMTETSSLAESEDVIEQLYQIPGVSFVDVVSVDSSDVAEGPQGSARGVPRSRRGPGKHAKLRA